MHSNLFSTLRLQVFVGLAFVFGAGMTMLGCNKSERQPAYIQLQPFQVTDGGGNTLHDLKESWVFLNGQFFGAYPTPSLIPILEEGNVTLEIFPGVNENGLKLSPSVYLPLTTYDVPLNLTPGETYTIAPTTKYKTQMTFPVGGSINFDEANPQPFQDLDTDPVGFFSVKEDTNSFTGKYGIMELDTAHPSSIIGFVAKMEGLPTSGDRQIWLEMNYRNDVVFGLDLLGSSANFSQEDIFPVYQFNRKDNWNKIYINLTNTVAISKKDKYRITLRTILPKDANGKYTQNTGFVAFDNIRLLHF